MDPQKNIFIAAAMRSGSTHLNNCLNRLGFKKACLHRSLEGCWNEDHMVDRDAASILLPMGGWVIQQHTRAIGRNVELLKHFETKPIITYRNVLDSIVSWDESQRLNIMQGRGNVYTFSPIHVGSWDGMDQQQREGWMLYNVVPWYYSFYVSWREADIDKLFIKYERHYKDQAAGLKLILDFIGAELVRPVTRKELECIAKVTIGKPNVCKSGRGRELLSQKFIDRCYEQADFWGPKWGPIIREELLDAR
jgi:hypothetical protein